MNWTVLAPVGEQAAVAVDPKGGLVPAGGGWSLDWWVAAEDRWHYASREVAVRQRLGPDGVAVESAMRVPGGDVVHTVYVCVAGGGGGATAVVELRNDSAVPVAVAFAASPRDFGGARPASFAVEGSMLRVDGAPGLRLPGEPADLVDGDAAVEGLGCVFPLPHTATLRAALPLTGVGVTDPVGLPSAAAVARGWSAHFQRSTRIDVPDERIQAVFEAARRRVLGASPGRVVSFPAIDRELTERDVALVANALAELGHRDEAAAVLDSAGWRALPEVAADDPLALIEAAAPTGAIASETAGGTGDDLAGAAQVALGLRRLVLNEAHPGSLSFLEHMPPTWEGRALEIHDAPMSSGQASVAVRWHGARPALLWSIDSSAPVRLRAPGLDPSWETREFRGEALLAEFRGTQG